MNLVDTIVALSTAPGRAGLGVVRLSGPDARTIAGRLLSPVSWQSWRAHMADLLDRDGRPIDQVVATFFEAPRSYTAEDVVEISCHGSPVVLHFACERAVEAGARLAEPGEFTLRAFARGRIDLPQAEAVRDLIEATTLYQARVAARQAGGSLSRRLAPLKQQFLDLIALLEAGIDFAEDDVSVASASDILLRLDPILETVRRLAASFQYGGFVRSGFTLAIVGRPNVGKSSLFNRLLEQDRAIVTDIPGTTRDLVSEHASIGGIPVKLYDTAGIRDTAGIVETLGIERSYQAMADADLTLVVFDISQPRNAEDDALAARAASQGRHLIVANKTDLCLKPVGQDSILPADFQSADRPQAGISVSALTGAGILELRLAILDSLAPPGAFDQDSAFITSLRHAQLLRESVTWLEKARAALDAAVPHEMLLLDLYAALRPIDAITGATTADDILNRIFSTFCIGK